MRRGKKEDIYKKVKQMEKNKVKRLLDFLL
jgi:hypothetical protein